MENELITYFLKLTTLTEKEKNGLLESMETISYKKNSILLKAGQLSNDTWFVLEGLVRQYIIKDDVEITTGFYTKGQWILTENSANKNNLNGCYYTCVEDSTIVIGNEKKAEQLFRQFPRFEAIARQVLEHVFFQQQEQLHAFITEKPEQRYLKLMNERPEILQKVPQYDIATYIGVKPESLSRIRKKLQQKN